MVFYRKFRPQTIKDLDNVHVRSVLSAVLSQKELPHAFLFSGPKGLGKTSTARIVAKVINCQKREKEVTEPCNACDECISIMNGTNLDVLEIDAASNRGIDEIRDLREKIKLSPVSAHKKIYIIDEVHMLTTEAFNALLKTLEEPPDHAVFILCTTELHKVPDTIVSRCFTISFQLATKEELLRSLSRIVKTERIDIEKEALEKITTLSEGSFRDGTKILEEILILSNGRKITEEMIEETYQTFGTQVHIDKLLSSIAKRDPSEVIQIIQSLSRSGTDMKFLTETLLQSLHGVLLIKLNVKENFSLKEETVSRLFTVKEIEELVKGVSHAYSLIKYSPIPSFPLELSLIEWITTASKPTENASSLQIKEKTIDDLRKQEKNSQIKEVIARHTGSASKKEETKNKEEATFVRQTSITKRTGGTDSFLDELIEEVKLKNHTVAGVLRGCKIGFFENDSLVLQTSYMFHKERLENEKVMHVIEKIASEISGKKIKVSVQLVEKKRR